MSYTKQTWNTGDTITAQKLNHMEDGIASSVGYDFALTIGGDSTTAEGLSLNEMAQKGALALKACMIALPDGTVFEAIGRTAIEGIDGTVVMFRFSDPNETTLVMRANGTGGLGEFNFTYTYSNGHYVFTRTGGGGEPDIH